MEGRLFLIGVAMGFYTWKSRSLKKSGGLNTPLRRGLWHGLFCSLAASAAALVLSVSMEKHTRFVFVGPNAFATSELYPTIIAAIIGFIYGFFRGKAEPENKRGYFLLEDSEWAETVFSAVLLAATIMYFVIQAFKIPSGSMENTLLIGDHLFVNKFVYGLRIPFTGERVFNFRGVKRGDIMVFAFPDQDPRDVHCGSVQYHRDFIKRVIGLPGDKIEVRAGQLILNGVPVKNEPYIHFADGEMRQPESVRAFDLSPKKYQELWQNHELDGILQDVQRDFFGPVVVPKNSYFMMGDNRDRSCDSRYWGPVSIKDVRGKAWFIYWPPSRMGVVH